MARQYPFCLSTTLMSSLPAAKRLMFSRAVPTIRALSSSERPATISRAGGLSATAPDRSHPRPRRQDAWSRAPSPGIQIVQGTQVPESRSRRSAHPVPRYVNVVNGAAVFDGAERVAIDHDQIGPFAGLQRPQVLCAQKARGASGRGDDRLHGRQAGVRHELEFPLLEIPRKPARRPGVGPESVADARVGKGFEVLFGGLENRAISAEVRVGTDRLLIISAPQGLDHTRG